MINFTLLNSTEEELTFQWNKIQVSTIKIPKDSSGNELKGFDLIAFLTYYIHEQQDAQLISNELLQKQDSTDINKKFGIHIDDSTVFSSIPMEISDEILPQKTPQEVIEELEKNKPSQNSFSLPNSRQLIDNVNPNEVVDNFLKKEMLDIDKENEK